MKIFASLFPRINEWGMEMNMMIPKFEPKKKKEKETWPLHDINNELVWRGVECDMQKRKYAHQLVLPYTL